MPDYFQQIVVPVDFSRNASAALEQAASLARRDQGQLSVVYVIPQAIFHPDWAADIEDTIDLDDITDEVRKTLQGMVAPYRQSGIHITEHVLSGGPYIEIIRLAEQIGADLIVIGAHGTSTREPRLAGSVAEKVMREAPCSVLMVRESTPAA